MWTTIARRAVVTSLLGLVCKPPASHAVQQSALMPLEAAQAQLVVIGRLLESESKWPEAARLLQAPPLQESTLAQAFDAVIDKPTAKDRLMDQAAFVVYYEEARYKDNRLEPQKPSRRAEQNGLKKEVLRAVADELAEVKFLIQEGASDADDLKAYSIAAQKAMADFLSLTSGS